MKKVFLTIALVAFAVAANAQFVVSGQFGFNTTGGNTHYEAVAPLTTEFDYPATKTSNFLLSPSIGYMLNDNMQVGLGLLFTTGSATNYGAMGAYLNGQEDWIKTNNSAFGLAPYFRYYFAQAGNFNFFCEATLAFVTSGRSHTHAYDNSTNPVYDAEADGPTSTSILDFSIVPGVNYKFNDNWSADCYIDLAGLAYTRTATKNYGTVTDPDVVTSTDVNTSFGLVATASAQTLNAHLGNFRIGINYHF
ncbi:MAG: outer membrane beta-barrel protein [Bacteroidales bacterium]|nr:outer membrane beta-barrel protein [Bacteroidales bacterium]